MERVGACGASFRSSLGLGMYAAGWIADAPPSSGSAPGSRRVVAYVVFATTFGGEAFRLIAAVGILALGLALTSAARRSAQPQVSGLTAIYISFLRRSWGIRSGLSLR